MNTLKAVSMGAILSLASVMPNAYALKNGQKFKAWTAQCQTVKKQKFCAVSQEVTNKQKEKMAYVSVEKIKGQADPIMTIMVPHGMELRAGAGFSIDKKKIIQVPYVVCSPIGCRAMFPLKKELLSQFKKGSKMQIYMLPFNASKEIVSQASLSGFSSALKAL